MKIDLTTRSGLLAMLFFICCVPVSALEVADYPELTELVETMVREDNYPKSELINILASAKIDNSIIEAMNRQYESQPWYRYKKLFINRDRIQRGVKFWRQHAALLQQAEQQYGVPQAIMVALIGVETHYGIQLGNKRVLDALVTLTARLPRRSRFFSSELRTFLNTIRAEKIDPTSVLGSFAGAIGIPQFMPSSYAEYSVDFNQNGTRDLVNEISDAIGSVANYLARHGWQRQKGVFAAVDNQDNLPPAAIRLVTERAQPKLSIDQLKQAGVEFAHQDASEQAALLKLSLEQGSRYVVGFTNFYVLTRYNPSINYAMVVVELAQQIRQRYHN